MKKTFTLTDEEGVNPDVLLAHIDQSFKVITDLISKEAAKQLDDICYEEVIKVEGRRPTIAQIKKHALNVVSKADPDFTFLQWKGKFLFGVSSPRLIEANGKMILTRMVKRSGFPKFLIQRA